jgi:four helix bundle protein
MELEFIEELKLRTKQLALRIIRVYRSLPKTVEAQVIGRQMLRSGTSVGANYRAVCRARSDAEFVSKLGIVIEEADESQYWLELLVEAEIVRGRRLASLMTDLHEIVSIFVAARETARDRIQKSKVKNQKSKGAEA